MHDELARGERFAENVFGEDGVEVRVGEDGDDGGADVFDAGDEIGFGQAFGAEFERTLARVGDGAELAAYIFAQVSFEVEGEIAGGVGDAGSGLPEGFIGGEFGDLLGQAGEIAREERDEFGGERHEAIIIEGYGVIALGM